MEYYLLSIVDYLRVVKSSRRRLEVGAALPGSVSGRRGGWLLLLPLMTSVTSMTVRWRQEGNDRHQRHDAEQRRRLQRRRCWQKPTWHCRHLRRHDCSRCVTVNAAHVATHNGARIHQCKQQGLLNMSNWNLRQFFRVKLRGNRLYATEKLLCTVCKKILLYVRQASQLPFSPIEWFGICKPKAKNFNR